MATFVPRATFPTQLSLPRSYYLGHHAAGLAKMKSMLSSVDLVLECRDYRVPLTSLNPVFETALAGRPRAIIYTKHDLGAGSDDEGARRRRRDDDIIRAWHRPSSVFFSARHGGSRSAAAIIAFLGAYSASLDRLTGTRVLVVGMPNVGKSTLLNALRAQGVGRPKAARTGAQPGITRRVASGVKVLEADARAATEAVYVVDTPGVFVPYVGEASAMLKLALVGAVKDTVVAPAVLADYLLFALNVRGRHAAYAAWSAPTNDVATLLDGVARSTGRLQRGRAAPDLEAAALWLIQRYRTGALGRFVLDDVQPGSLALKLGQEVAISMSAARRARKDEQRARSRRRVGGVGVGVADA
jgi:ribosome biogenesis GTPase A